MLEFIHEYHWSKLDCNYWPAISSALESKPLDIQRVLYGLIFDQVIEVHRTAVGMGGVNKKTQQPWVEVDSELQARGLPDRLPTLGPLESMQMMMEIQSYMRRAAKDPSILLSRQGWRECFKVDPARPWTELFSWRAEYNSYIHEQGGGFTAARKATKENFHTATVEKLYEDAQEYQGNDLFNTIASIFCTEFANGMEHADCKKHNDYGWFKKLRAGGSASAAYHRFLGESGVSSRIAGSGEGADHAQEEHEEVAGFRPGSRLMKPYSMNEPFFANLKHKHSHNNQMGISGLSAQSIEEQNGSFKPGARLSKLNRVALLVVRKHVRGERANVQFNLKELAEKQVQLKLDMRALRVEEQLGHGISWSVMRGY